MSSRSILAGLGLAALLVAPLSAGAQDDGPKFGGPEDVAFAEGLLVPYAATSRSE